MIFNMKAKGSTIASTRTKKLIKKVFCELLNEKQSISLVKISDIARRSGITRATIYSHFDNVNDIAYSIQHDLIEISKDSTRDAINTKNIDNFIETFIDELEENKMIYSKLFKTDELVKSIVLLGQTFSKGLIDIVSQISGKKLSKPNRMSIEFFTEGFVLMIIRYYREESSFKLNEMKSFLKEAFHNNIHF